MPDIFVESEISVQTLAVQKVLEGLIHNLNTPLNLILGYSQQLKKLHPELANLEKIYNAGLQIDDLIQSCARQISSRLQGELTQFDLNYWIVNEVKLLNNLMEIKRNVVFETILPPEGLLVETSSMLLSLFIESLVIFIKNSTAYNLGSPKIKIELIDLKDKANLSIFVPMEFKDKHTLKPYLQKLQTELESFSKTDFSSGVPFSWQVVDESIVQITFSMIG
jgi:signal transduction histidine kinase